MDKKTEALKLAQDWYDSGNENHDDFANMIKQVIALAEQPAQQEPVAYWTDLWKEADEIVRGKTMWKRFIDGTPLANDIAVWMADFAQQHTSPQPSKPWVGLTEEEVVRVCVPLGAAMLSFTEVARAIEAKLKEKNIK
jgi:hypothetical protein